MDLQGAVKPLSFEKLRVLNVLELFSGIGGMRYALTYAGLTYSNSSVPGLPLEVRFHPIDINPAAATVYLHNFPNPISSSSVRSELYIRGEHQYHRLVDITSLTLDFFHTSIPPCSLWTMSPPCQPYTEQAGSKQLDHADSRSNALLHLLDILSRINETHLPQAIIFENVKGFAKSKCCEKLLQTLHARGFCAETLNSSASNAVHEDVITQQGGRLLAGIISPIDVGFPNERKRFYLVALRGHFFSQRFRTQNGDAASFSKQNPDGVVSYDSLRAQMGLSLEGDCKGNSTSMFIHGPSLASFVNFANDNHNFPCDNSSASKPHSATDPITKSKREVGCKICQLYISNSVLSKPSSYCADIVYAAAKTSWLPPRNHGSGVNLHISLQSTNSKHVKSNGYAACFTKSYGRYFNGTGSLWCKTDIKAGFYSQKLSAAEDLGESVVAAEMTEIFSGRLRRFSPEEVAGLMGFKCDISIPLNERFAEENGITGGVMNFWNALCWHSHPKHICLPVRDKYLCSGMNFTDKDTLCSCAGYPIQKSMVYSAPQAKACGCCKFSFPASIDTTSRWKLLGNSLNPQLVGLIIVSCFITEYYQDHYTVM